MPVKPAPRATIDPKTSSEEKNGSARQQAALQAATPRPEKPRKTPKRNSVPRRRKRKAPRAVNHVRLTLLIAMLFTLLVATMFRTETIVFTAAMLCAAPLMGVVGGRFLNHHLAVTRQIPLVGMSGDTIAGRVTLRSSAPVSSFLIHLWPGEIADREIPPSATSSAVQAPLALCGEAEYIVPLLRKNEPVELAPQWILGRRGVYELPPVLAGARDPLGLFTTGQAKTSSDTITILPRPVRITRLAVCGGTQAGAHSPQTANVAVDASDFHGIRAWRPGEGIRRVHWKNTARTGQLHVVEWEENPGCDLTVLFDARSFAPSLSTQYSDLAAADEALETGIILAASAASHLLESGRVFRFFCWQPTEDDARFRVTRYRAQRSSEISGALKMLAGIQTIEYWANAAHAQNAHLNSLARLAEEVAPEVSRHGHAAGATLLICSAKSDYAEAAAVLRRGTERGNAPFILAVDGDSFDDNFNLKTQVQKAPAASSGASPLDIRVVKRGDSLTEVLER